MAYKRKEIKGETPKLDMMPMIDVVFQLLIFFVVTLKYEDILSRLEANRPAPDAQANKESKPTTIDIVVDANGYFFNNKRVRLHELDYMIEKQSAFSKTATVLVKCYGDAPHGGLMQALDICHKHGMHNISMFSLAQ